MASTTPRDIDIRIKVSAQTGEVTAAAVTVEKLSAATTALGQASAASATSQSQLAASIGLTADRAAQLVASAEATIRSTQEQIALQRAQIQAFDQARTARQSFVQAETAAAQAAAAARGQTAQQIAQLKQLAVEERAVAQAVKARQAQANADRELSGAAGLQRQIALLREVTQGTRSLADAERLLAVERARAQGLTIGQAGRLVSAQQELAALQAVTGAAQRATPAITALGVAQQSAALQAQALAARFGVVGLSLGALSTSAIGAVAAVAGLGKVLLDSVRFSRAMETQFADLRAILNVSAESVAFLRDQSLEMARTMGVSAVEVVESFKLIAAAKSDLLENADALAEVTRQSIILAQASGTILPEAAKSLVNTLNQMRYSAEEASRVVNTLAAGSKFGAAEIPYLNEAIVKAGSAAGSAGLSIEELVAAIETIASLGEPAEIAGTAMNAVFTKLSVGIAGTSVRANGLGETLKALAEKGFDQVGVAATALDVRQAKFLSNLVGLRDLYEEYLFQVTNTSTALEQQAIRMDTVNGAIARLGGQYETLLNKFGDSSGLLKDLINLTTVVLRILTTVDGYKTLFAVVAAGLGLWAAPAVAAATGLTALGAGVLTAVGSFGLMSGAQELLKSIFSETIPVVDQLADRHVFLFDKAKLLEGADKALFDLQQPLTVALAQKGGEMVTVAAQTRDLTDEIIAQAQEEQRLFENRKRATEGARDTATRLRAELDAVKSLGPKATPADLAAAKAGAKVIADTGDSPEGQSLAKQIAADTKELKEREDAINANARAFKSLGTDQKNAIEQAKEQTAILQGEVQARLQSVAAGEDEVTTNARIAAAKTLVQTGSAALAAQMFEEAKAAGYAREESEKLKAAHDALRKSQETATDLSERIAKLKELRDAGASYEEIQRAMAELEGKQLDRSGKLKDALGKQAGSVHDLTKEYEAQQAVVDSLNSLDLDIAATEAQIAINEKLIAGEIDYAEALRQRAVAAKEAEAAAKGSTLTDEEIAKIRQLADLTEELSDKAKQASAAVFNVGESFSKNFASVVEGIATGTNKGISFFKGLGQALKATWNEALGNMIQSKLGFDLKISSNFLQEIPGIVAQGAGLMQGIFGNGLANMGAQLASFGASLGSGGSGSGFFGSILGALGTGLGGLGSLFGGGAEAAGSLFTGGAGLLQLGSAVASGNGAGILSNTSTMISILQKLYSAYSTWAAGGSFSSVLNAGFGGLLQPLLSGISSIAPGLASTLGIGSTAGPGLASLALGGNTTAALAAISAATGGNLGLGLGTVPSLAALVNSGNSAAALAAIQAGQAASQVASTLSVAAPYLAIIGGIIATNVGVAGSLNSDVYDRAFTLKDRRRAAYGGAVDNFIQEAIAQATTLWILRASDLQEAAQKTFRGEGSAGDIVQTILQVFTNLPALIVAAFSSSLPTGGTATRAAFEDFIEDARKHQSRAFNPFFGSVPALDPATGQFVIASGQFDRNLGQGKVRDRLRQKYGSDKDTPDGAFVETMRELIYEEGRALSATDALAKSAIGLSVAFKAVQLGEKGGTEIQRYLANALELVANLREAGASAALSMQFIRFEVARLGDPARVFNEVGDALKEGHLDAETYREAIEGLANVYFKLAAEGELQFDLSDKSNKGLKVAQEQLDAIRGIIQDVPPGVQVAKIAIDLLNDAIDETGKQGPITFEALKEAIDAAAASAQKLNPIVQEFASTLAAQGPDAQKAGGFEKLLTDSTEAVIQKFEVTVRDAVVNGITEGFITASINTGVLGPLQLAISDAMEKFALSGRTPEDMAALVATIQTAGQEAIAEIKLMEPAFRELGQIILGVSEALNVSADAADNAAATIASSSLSKGFEAIARGPGKLTGGQVDAFVSGQLKEITANFEAQLRDATIKAVYDGFLESLSAGALGDITERVSEASQKLSKGEITNEEFFSIVSQAMADAKLAVNELAPAIERLAYLGSDIAAIFADATENSAIAIATAIVQLAEAQKKFNQAFDARIFALRNQGRADPAALRAQGRDVQREFDLTKLSAFGTVTDVIAAVNKGLISQSEMESYLKQTPGMANEMSPEQKLATIDKLRALVEQGLEIEIAAIQAEGAAQIAAHQDRIDALQEEREAIQDAAAEAIQARQDELDLLQEQITLMEQWATVLDQTKDTILKLRTGSTSPLPPTVRLRELQDAFAKARATAFDPNAKTADRTAAAAKLNELAPQILQLGQQAGLAQTSEAFRALFDDMMKALDDLAALAGGESDGLEAAQARAEKLQKEIKDIQKESEKQLRAIDKSIKAEQKAIEAVQKSMEKKIDAANQKAADQLEWLQGKGNEIFVAKQDELGAKLDGLATSGDIVNLADISADSLTQLQAIRYVLEGKGIKVDDKPFRPVSAGQFGITATGQRRLSNQLGELKTTGTTYANLGKLLGISSSDIAQMKAAGGALAELIEGIQAIFPRAGDSGINITLLANEMRKKIADPNYVSPVLGFATGGIVTKPTRVVAGDGYEPEAIIPLSRFGEIFRNVITESGGSAGPPIVQQEVNFNFAIAVEGTVDLGSEADIERNLERAVRRIGRRMAKDDPDYRATLGRVAREAVKSAPRS